MNLSDFQKLDIILVCGLPGAGKSHFAQRYFDTDGRRRINRKELRRLFFEMLSFGKEWKEEFFDEEDDTLVKYIERRSCEHLLQHGKKILVDNTSVTRASRSAYVQLAQRERKSIGCIFVNTPLATCFERNQARPHPIPDGVISNLYTSIELPDTSEGFVVALVVKE